MMTLELRGGPNDGESTGLGAGALPLELTRGGHRYVRTQDDTGAPFYEWRGLVVRATQPAEAA